MGCGKYETVEMIRKVKAGQTRDVGQPWSSLGVRPPNLEPHLFISEDLQICSVLFPPICRDLGPCSRAGQDERWGNAAQIRVCEGRS